MQDAEAVLRLFKSSVSTSNDVGKSNNTSDHTQTISVDEELSVIHSLILHLPSGLPDREPLIFLESS